MDQPSSSESSPEHNLTDMGKFSPVRVLWTVPRRRPQATISNIWWWIQQRSKKRSKLNLNMRMQTLRMKWTIHQWKDFGYKIKMTNSDIGRSTSENDPLESKRPSSLCPRPPYTTTQRCSIGPYTFHQIYRSVLAFRSNLYVCETYRETVYFSISWPFTFG